MAEAVLGVAKSDIGSMRRSPDVKVDSRDLAVTAACVWAVLVDALGDQAIVIAIPHPLPDWLSYARRLIEDRLSVLDKDSLDFSDIVAIYSATLRSVIARRYGRDGLALYSVIVRKNNRELTSHLQALIDRGARFLGIPDDYADYVALGVTNTEARKAAEMILKKCSQ